MPQEKSLFERLDEFGIGCDTPQDKALRMLAEEFMRLQSDRDETIGRRTSIRGFRRPVAHQQAEAADREWPDHRTRR